MVDEPHERSEIRKSLMLLNWALEKDDAQLRFDLPSLQKHNIHLEHLSLDKGSANNPRFFAPYPNVPPVTDEIAEEAKEDPPNWDLISPYRYALGFHFLLHQYAFDGIVCENDSLWAKKDWPWVQAPGRLWNRLDCKGVPRSPNREDASDSLEVSRAANSQLPHIQAVIAINGKVKNGEFLRVEILAALRLMIHQMRQIRLIPHMKIPAMVMSILGNRVRLIEAFCEDGKIIFRATRLYDLPGEYIIASEQFAEWFYGSPIGDTS